VVVIVRQLWLDVKGKPIVARQSRAEAGPFKVYDVDEDYGRKVRYEAECEADAQRKDWAKRSTEVIRGQRVRYKE